MGFKIQLKGERVVPVGGEDMGGERVAIVDGDSILSEITVITEPCAPGAYKEFRLCAFYHLENPENQNFYNPCVVDAPPAKFASEECRIEKERQVERIRALSTAQSPSYDDIMDIISNDPHAKSPKINISAAEECYSPKSFDELLEEFRATQTAWKESPYYETFVSRIQELKRSTCVPITNVVALGTGSIHKRYRDTDEWSRAYARVGTKQLSAAMALQELLGEPGQPLPCTIQDPVYSDLEKLVLTALGFKVVDYPDVRLEIKSGSIVFYLATQLSMAWEIGQGIWPAAMICNAWDAPDKISPERIPQGFYDFVRFMFKQYERKPFQSVGHEKKIKAEGVTFMYQLKQKL